MDSLLGDVAAPEIRQQVRMRSEHGPKSLNLPLNPFTLAFSGSLETEYLDDFFNKSLKQARLILLSGIVFYGIFGFLTRSSSPGPRAPSG